MVIDGSGDNIYITSSQQLTVDDIDTVSDVYDVRRGGGLSFKELPPCAGEACQPASTPAPDDGAPATNGAGGEGNYRPATISIKAMSSSQRAKLVAGQEAEVPLRVSGPGKISLKGDGADRQNVVRGDRRVIACRAGGRRQCAGHALRARAVPGCREVGC